MAVVMNGDIQKNRWQKLALTADFYTVKGLVESLFAHLGYDKKRILFKENTLDTVHFHPYQSAVVYLGKDVLGIIGKIHPQMAKEYSITKETVMAELRLDVVLKNKAAKVKFKPLSKYPAITRDLAFVVEENVQVQQIADSIERHGKLDKEHIITFQSAQRTLKDDEINEVHQVILSALEKDVHAVLRG